MARKVKGGGASVDRLLSLLERIERLVEERKALADDIKEIFGEAKAAGFDPKVMRQMIKERAQSPEERREWSALCDVYRAALGMLDGTPLGDHARKRFEDRQAPPDDSPPHDSSDGHAPHRASPPEDGQPSPADAPRRAAPAAPSTEDLLTAKAEGAAAAKAGRRVMENPYPAGDARRAAWDEGWCSARASDGMDIPDAWRRSKPKKPDGATKDGGGKDGGAPA